MAARNDATVVSFNLCGGHRSWPRNSDGSPRDRDSGYQPNNRGDQEKISFRFRETSRHSLRSRYMRVRNPSCRTRITFQDSEGAVICTQAAATLRHPRQLSTWFRNNWYACAYFTCERRTSSTLASLTEGDRKISARCSFKISLALAHASNSR